MLDIEVLRVIWWALIGFLFIGFAVTDGFDLGAAVLFPLIAKNEDEREAVLNAIGPFWEGNQVWIITAAGSLFAAWPFVYAVAFSGAYFVVLLLLLTMGISRPVSFKYRSKLPNLFWRRFWDCCVFIGGLVPAIILGMLVGNMLVGLPFYFDNDLRVFYNGNFFDLFNPFALWCGFTSLAMLCMHGGLFLAIKLENPVRLRAIYWAKIAALCLLIFFIGGGFIVGFALTGYQASGVDPLGFSDPLQKTVVTATGAWLRNYNIYPFSIFAPVIGIAGALLVLFTASSGQSRIAFVCSGLSIIGVIVTAFVSMFPFILPSSSNPGSSLLVWDASSSALTLLLMLFGMIIFMPLILLYTTWVYRAMSGKARSEDTVKEQGHY